MEVAHNNGILSSEIERSESRIRVPSYKEKPVGRPASKPSERKRRDGERKEGTALGLWPSKLGATEKDREE